MKFLLFLLFVALLWVVWRLRSRSTISPPQAPRAEEPMVSCANCGVYLPQSESVAEGPNFFCSEAHRQAGSAGK